MLVSFITAFMPTEMRGTLSGEDHTDAPKRPPSINDQYIFNKPALRSGKSISPALHSAESNIEIGKSIVSVSPTLISIISDRSNEIALCFDIDNI